MGHPQLVRAGIGYASTTQQLPVSQQPHAQYLCSQHSEDVAITCSTLREWAAHHAAGKRAYGHNIHCMAMPACLQSSYAWPTAPSGWGAWRSEAQVASGAR